MRDREIIKELDGLYRDIDYIEGMIKAATVKKGKTTFNLKTDLDEFGLTLYTIIHTPQLIIMLESLLEYEKKRILDLNNELKTIICK